MNHLILSLRDSHKSVECLDHFSPDLWPGGRDGYFAFHMDLMGSRIGRGDECAKFSTQHEYSRRSFVARRITELDSPSHEHFLEYCLDVNQIM